MGRETRMICLTDLVCLSELGEAFAALERARRDRTIARSRLMTLRESLDRVLDEAFRRQSFGPLKGLFRVEEMALAEYERTAGALAQAVDRWNAVQTALACESHLMRSDLSAPHLRN